ncbi:Exocyst complex component 7 [Intoshia linei]|uniref:Exocyst complex component 7 n=1 Tax=Intoshia linei TaxID=1819745 RepID=A0A177AZH6_9BILA|nr:Exocyst complex component 7 [Intoshia linei]
MEHKQVYVDFSKEKENMVEIEKLLNKSNELSLEMSDLMHSFDEKLGNVEKLIKPLYKNMEERQRAQNNMDQLEKGIDTVLGYYKSVVDIEKFIQDAGDIPNITLYISKIQELKLALDYFESIDKDNHITSQAASLFEACNQRLEIKFTNILSQAAKDFDITKFFLFITNNLNEEYNVILVNTDTIYQLVNIGSWLEMSKVVSNYVDEYVDNRSECILEILATIKCLTMSSKYKIHFRRRSMNSLQKMGSKIFRKSAAGFLDLSKRKEKTASIPFNKQNTVFTSNIKDEIGESEILSFVDVMNAFLQILEPEIQLAQTVLSHLNYMMITSRIIKPVILNIETSANKLKALIARMIQKKEFTCISSLLTIVSHFKKIRFNLFAELADCDEEIKVSILYIMNLFSELLDGNTSLTPYMYIFKKSGHTTTKNDWKCDCRLSASALRDYVEYVRTDTDKISSMPTDGTVHEITTNVLFLMENMYQQHISIGYSLMPAESKMITSFDDHTIRLKSEEYFKKCYDALRTRLRSMADNYPEKMLQSLFMINNYHHMFKALNRIAFVKSLGSIIESVAEEYSSRIEKYTNHYIVHGWGKLTEVIQSIKRLSYQRTEESNKIKEKDKSRIKDIFSSFNKEYEHAMHLQKMYTIADSRLRADLRKKFENLIEPYIKFYQSHVYVNFSKSPTKYIKYNPTDIKESISALFDN